jgi:uncharacterized protein YdeI (YjbR/CyaY-like superfamily)
MPYNKQVDAYIAKAAPFAQPVLEHLRELIHRVCPDVEEKIKWSAPHFDYQGPMVMMAAFKKHCAIGFWKAALMNEESLIRNAESESAMGHLGKIESMDDLPSDKKLEMYIRKAMRLNEEGIKLERPKASAKPVVVPADLKKELSKNKTAGKIFASFSPSQQREYTEWITAAKTEATRLKRLATTIEWLVEGKQRNWKYMKK